MTKISRSPERHSFQATFSDGTNSDFYTKIKEFAISKEEDPLWAEDNMEYDLRTTDWILEKVRNSKVYSQNLYAAMCNRTFQKAEMWPILSDKKWSCSWRYAGGIIANMRQQGDYIDWYCSGIRGAGISDDEYATLTEDQKVYYHESTNYVGEGVVTEEIEADLKRLGWMVLAEEEW